MVQCDLHGSLLFLGGMVGEIHDFNKALFLKMDTCKREPRSNPDHIIPYPETELGVLFTICFQ